ncbi:MAG: hypothetical protein EKK53_16495 [Burkholderiales bacterium]|nr:MAG: hypothetical protein EKK53_16495 [Burkholderiales bacterium]
MSTLPLALEPLALRRAVLLNLASSVGETGLRFLLGLVLARLLLPAELGLFALAMAIYSVAQWLRDAGLSTYLQREPVLTPERLSAVLGLMGGTTLLTTAGLWALAEPLSAALGQPGLAGLLQVLAAVLPVSAFGSVMAALQLRMLAAGPIARVSLLGLAVQGGVSVLACRHGAGALGLAWAQLAAALACGAAYATLRPAGWAWRPGLAGATGVMSFSLAALLPNALTFLNGVLPDLLLGRLGGAHALGLYGRALSTVGLLQVVAARALSFGSLPVLSQRHAQGQALAPALGHAAAVLTGIGWPLLALTVAYREPLVLALYGAAWREAASAVPPLALAAALALLCQQLGPALAAVGRPALAAGPVAVTLGARVVLALWWFDGSVASFAWALGGAAVLVLPLQLALGARHGGPSPRALLSAVSGSAVAAGVVVLVPLTVAPLAWIAVLRATRHPLLPELDQLSRRFMTSRK